MTTPRPHIHNFFTKLECPRTIGTAIAVVALLATIAACSKWDLVRAARIAATGDVTAAQSMAAEKALRYAARPQSLPQDIEQFKADAKNVATFLTSTVQNIWGKDNVQIPSPKRYVKYTENFYSRAMVDFDGGWAQVETIDRKRPKESLRNAIVTVLLTPEDPRAVNLYSAEPVKLGATPFLYREVRDHDGKEIRWQWRAERYADFLIRTRLKKRAMRTGETSREAYAVRFDLIRDHLRVRARKYRHWVEQYAGRYHVSPNLVFAVIQTESGFNPHAVSSAPAFGLMQIVPESAGRDVYGFLHGQNGTPGRDFLMQPENSILYGTVYLHLLERNFFPAILDPVSREYCVIAAYNTGPSNVLRTFDSNKDRAWDRINRLPPDAVYRTLRSELPYRETREYLARVLHSKKDFIAYQP
jgi:membrane-bound lytic murein transglycosylase C